jgi:hypothetical protein
MATHPPIHAMPWSNPGFEPLPTLMIRTLQFANLEYGDESGEFVFNLPERTPIGVYTQVGNKLETGQPMIDAGQDAFHLTSIRARGSKAEVDLLYPGPDGTMLFVGHAGDGRVGVTRTRPDGPLAPANSLRAVAVPSLPALSGPGQRVGARLAFPSGWKEEWSITAPTLATHTRDAASA